MIDLIERARQFHEIYERLAPKYGYETREETKNFDPNSANGQLMIAVMKEIAALSPVLPDECKHEWVDPSNKVVDAGEYRLCLKCNSIAIPESPVLPEDVKAMWCYLRANNQTDAADMLKRLARENAQLKENWEVVTKTNNELFDSAQKDIANYKQRIAELEGQLPEGMRECTIVFEECEKGHGYLRGTNWIKHDCPWCRIAELESLIVDVYTLGTWHEDVDERLDRAVQRIVGDKQ